MSKPKVRSPKRALVIGRIVQYWLSNDDLEELIAGPGGPPDLSHLPRSGGQLGGHPADAAAAVAVPGELLPTFPAVIVRVLERRPFDPRPAVNLQVFLDGPVTYWAPGRHRGTEPGTWRWPRDEAPAGVPVGR